MEKSRLLIVEDDDIIALHLESDLNFLGYTVVGRTDNGSRAVELAGDLTPDLVLMDVGLRGGMDGISAAEQIRARWGYPVVYLTAFSDVQTLERAKLSRPYGYILKPFSPQMLQTTIEIAVYQHRAELEVRSLSRFPDEDPAPVMRISAQGLVLYANRSSEPLIRHWVCAKGQSIPAEWRGHLDAALAGEQREVDVVCGERIFACVWTPLPAEAYINLYAHDVSERRRAERELQSLNNDLEKRVSERTAQLELALRELETFSYSVSHDLRAPLRAINGFGRLLEEDYGVRLDAQGLEYLARIQEGSRRMSQLIDDLLNLSRLTRREMKIEAVNLSELARAALRELSQANPERTVEQVVTEGVIVQGDGYSLRAVMDNLLGNAWKFSARCEQVRIEFGWAMRGSERVYFVRDNGIGFDMAFSAKLFGAFQRLHSQAEFEGNGIGLATVQRIIRRHQGDIWAEGHIGGGATFYFTLGISAPGQPGG